MVNLDFPEDLVRDQHAWNHACRQLAVCRPEEYAVLRRRLLRLSCRIACHPHWADLRRHTRHHRLVRAA